MSFFIKKIFEGKTDEQVHAQFQKFSRGEFPQRAMVKGRFSSGKWNISTTAEYANELVRYMAEKVGEKSILVRGIVVTTEDLQGKLEFQDKKQFMGIKQYIIEREMTGNEIINLCDSFPKAFFALSFSTEDIELKIKEKAPKSAKPSTKTQDKPKIDFCKIKTTNKEIVQGLIFDEETSSFKKVEIVHTFKIKEIVPQKGETDFAKIRENATRKGVIVRDLTVDEKKFSKKIEFEA